MRRSPPSRAMACSSAPATPRVRCVGFRNLSEAGLDEARSEALSQGRVETPVGIGRMVLQRVGSGADVGLVALMMPTPGPPPADIAEQPVAPPGELPIPDYEQPAMSGEAPAEFALFDEFATSPPEETLPALPPEPEPEPQADRAAGGLAGA